MLIKLILDIFYSILILLNLFNSLTFLFIKHPLSIGLILLIQTILIRLFTGLIIKTFWFSYILFLIFIGGILVLFIYVTSLASNDLFKINFKILSILLIIFRCLSLFLLFIDKNIIFFYFINHETFSFDILNKFILENSQILNKLYNFPINLITIALIIFLLITLIAIVKITNVFEGPLRPKNI